MLVLLVQTRESSQYISHGEMIHFPREQPTSDTMNTLGAILSVRAT